MATRFKPLRRLDDDALAAEAATGNERALELIVERYQGPLYRYCTGILGDPDQAADAVQNTMVSALGGLAGEKRSIALRPWLYRIAHNESISLMRKRRPDSLVGPEEELERVGGAALVADSATRARLAELLSDLRELPERQRSAILLRELNGLEYEEVAAALAISSNAARQAVFKARQSLQATAAGRTARCEPVQASMSANDRRFQRRREIRAHLDECEDCRAFALALTRRPADLGVLFPAAAVAGAGAGAGAASGSGSDNRRRRVGILFLLIGLAFASAATAFVVTSDGGGGGGSAGTGRGQSADAGDSGNNEVGSGRGGGAGGRSGSSSGGGGSGAGGGSGGSGSGGSRDGSGSGGSGGSGGRGGSASGSAAGAVPVSGLASPAGVSGYRTPGETTEAALSESCGGGASSGGSGGSSGGGGSGGDSGNDGGTSGDVGSGRSGGSSGGGSGSDSGVASGGSPSAPGSGNATGTACASASGGGLPLTGLAIGGVLAAALMLLATGFALRRTAGARRG